MENSKGNSPRSRPFLSWDVLEYILSRIPAKRLLLWRLVSKSWCNFIDENLRPLSLLFLRQHFSRNAAHEGCFWNPIGPLRLHKRGEGKLALRFVSLHPDLKFMPILLPNYHRYVMSFCNGLYLCCEYEYLFSLFEKPKYIVCNPAIRTSITLPNPPNSRSHTLCDVVTVLAYNPRESMNYKILAWYQCNESTDTLFLAIYSSEDNNWGGPYDFQYTNFHGEAKIQMETPMNVFFNGHIYLFNHDSILRINITTGICLAIHLPMGVGEKRDNGLFHLGMLNGELCCAHIDGRRLSVWRLQDDKNWDLIHCNKDVIPTKYQIRADVPHIVAFDPMSDVIVVRIWSTLSFYDTRHSKLEHVCELISTAANGWHQKVVEPFYPYLLPKLRR